MGFFGILALIFVGLWLLGKLLPFLLVGLISRQQKRWANSASGGATGGGAGAQRKKEGEVTIEQSTTSENGTPKVSKQVGDYVDYEETN